jgi:hypothetical protein
MTHRMKVAALGTMLAGAACLCALAGSPSVNEDRFTHLKSLAGDWTMAGGDGSVAVNYKLTGAGSAVVETLFPGEDHEMVTIYTMDKGDLVLTHYCAMANQPHMKAAKGGDAGTIAFKFDGAGNMASPKDVHMHDMEMTFVDADHVKAAWHLYTDGKESEVKNFDLVRKKS